METTGSVKGCSKFVANVMLLEQRLMLDARQAALLTGHCACLFHAKSVKILKTEAQTSPS